jgi:hypothetical protein
VLELFPPNGLDRSILTPVLIGLGFTTLFAETLGWPFVALVVPGYLSGVLIAAPLSGATIIGEALVTYAMARALGYWLPRAGGWTVFFGRERFFLLIACSIVVRLAAEGLLLPWLSARFSFRHASELYSIGLVLVPLVANALWNVGFVRGVFCTSVLTALTYFTVDLLVLPYTNLALAKFELTYESVALDFLGAPKPYLLLLGGTIIAARSNILYGWDYNGILVPGLLAVAWYSPTKLLSTLAEAVVVATLARGVILVPPFRGALIEGPRRVLLTFLVGFAVKLALGYGALSFWPGMHITDLYGFGYVLPTLIAVKIWQKGSVPQVVVPTVIVSFLGFAAGNALGYSMRLATESRAVSPPPVVEASQVSSAAWELTLGAAWPQRIGSVPDDSVLASVNEFSSRVRAAQTGSALESLAKEGLSAARAPRDGGGAHWIVRRPREDKPHLPAVSITDAAGARGIVLVRARPGGPEVALAVELAEGLDAAAILVLPNAAVRAEPWLEAMEGGGTGPVAVSLVRRDDGTTRLTRQRVNVARFSAAVRELGVPAETEPMADELTLPPKWLSRRAATALRNGDAEPERLDRFEGSVEQWLLERSAAVDAGDEVSARTPEAIRLFTSQLAPVVRAFDSRRRPDAYALALARRLDLRFLRIGTSSGRALALTPRAGQRGFVWIRRGDSNRLVVAAPNPDPALGMHRVTLSVAELSGASDILLGVGPLRFPEARGSGLSPVDRSFYQRALELLLSRGRRIVALEPIPRDRASIRADLVLTTGDVTPNGAGAPPWSREVAATLERWAYDVTWYDGARELYPYRGVGDPALAYARRYAPDQLVVAWWSPAARSRYRPTFRRDLMARLERRGHAVEEQPVARALERRLGAEGACDLRELRRMWARYLERDNPHTLYRVLDAGERCDLAVVQDPMTELRYVLAHDGRDAIAFRTDVPFRGRPRDVRRVEEAERAVLAHLPAVRFRGGD